MDDLFCALLHLDYFFLYLTAFLFAVTLLYTLLFVFWDCFKKYVELRVLNQHNKLVKIILDAQEYGEAYDRLFEKQGYPDYYCRNRTYIPLQYDAIESLRGKNACFTNNNIYKNNHNSKSTIEHNHNVYLEMSQEGKKATAKEKLEAINKATTVDTEKEQESIQSNINTSIQRSLVRQAVKKFDKTASEEEVSKYYHYIYPGHVEHYSLSDEEILQQSRKEFGNPKYSRLSDKEKEQITKDHLTPSIHHIHTKHFQAYLKKKMNNYT